MDYNFELFNAITKALSALEIVRNDLISAQRKAESVYIESEDLYIFRSLATDEVGVLRSQTAKEAWEILSETLDADFELDRVSGNGLYVGKFPEHLQRKHFLQGKG